MTSDLKSPKRLTLEERLQVACYHSFGAKHPNWVVDSTHGHPVCCHCGKPSPELILRRCTECDDDFVAEFDSSWQSKYFLIGNKTFQRDAFCKTCY